MEFVIWFGLVLVGIALAGEHLFPVVLLAAVAQILLGLGSVFAGRRRYVRDRDW